jgi:Uma2 family endonuclease
MVTDLQSRPFRFDAARRYTIEEYYRLVEEGLLEEDARVELLDGQIVPMSPVGPRHHWIVDKLLRAFLDQEKGRFKTSQNRSLPIANRNVPEPDLMLYWIDSADEQRHVRPDDVFLVVEVALSTLEDDLNFMANLYRGAKIAEYWVVDLKGNCLHVFTLEGDRYQETILERGRVSPRAFPDVTIDLEGLFGVR